MFQTLMLAAILSAYPPVSKEVVLLPNGKKDIIYFYPIAQPANPSPTLTLTTRVHDKVRTAILTKDASGQWRGVLNLTKPLTMSHPITGLRTQTMSLTYLLRTKENSLIKWNDKKTNSWYFEACMVPTGVTPPEKAWAGADAGFEYNPFLFRRVSIGTIR